MTSTIATAPHRLPLLGHFVPLLRDPAGFVASLPAYGDLVRIGMGPITAVMVCDPQLTQQVLRHDRVFDKGGPVFDRAREAIGDGLGTCPYSRHRRLRRLMQPAFHPSRIAEYASVMSQRIIEIAESWRDGQIIDVRAQMKTLTLQVTTATLFAHSVPEPSLRRIFRDVDTVVDGVMRRAIMPGPLLRLPILGNRAYWPAITRLRAVIGQVIAERRAADIHPPDLLSAVVDARDTDGGGLSDPEIVDQILTLFVAGTETTASALQWALYLLDENPDLAARLRIELDTVLAGRPARYDDLPQLPLTGRIITETLRVRSPFWLATRTVTEDTELGGHPLAKGAIVAYSPYLLHHRADLYPEPDRFDPDRWDPAVATPAQRSALIPFSDGARKCIGDTFAVTEAVLALATIATRWELRGVPAQDTSPALSSILRPRKLRMRVTARHAPAVSCAVSDLEVLGTSPTPGRGTGSDNDQ
ncbi:cytochrome P450 [Nocardia sp. NBC_01499]|uniref:cytochrome P450 n=1 Tax=Nocardia sp. NBC_01499 TaxID=2903597 RepID=UPI00386EADF7